MRNQVGTLAIFFIIIGVAIFIYYIILPLPLKEQFLQEVYNSTLFLSNSSSQSPQFLYQFQNIEISPQVITYYIAENTEIGSLYESGVVNLNNIQLYTNIFEGNKYLYYFFYYNSSQFYGINISFGLECSNGNFNIYINGFKVFSGCENGLEDIYIDPGYLNNGNNKLEIIFSPSNIFSNAQLYLNNFQIIYDSLSYINYTYYYNGGNAELYYNFCPTNPDDIYLYINGNYIPLSSCSNMQTNNPLYISNYLQEGVNYIYITSQIPTQLNLYLENNNNEFYLNFPSNVSLLYIVTGGGEGNVNINNICKYNIYPYQYLYAINITQCLMNGNYYNILLITSNTGLNINLLELQ